MKPSNHSHPGHGFRPRSLRQMQALATGLLGLMAVVFVAAHLAEAKHPGWGYVRAFAEAAMVGALADWFAVVALFRHPLGLPIPHTAILPNNKERIADSLGRFISEHFLHTQALRPKLAQLDLAGMAGAWLTKNSASVAERLAGLIPRLLTLLDDASVRRFLHHQLIVQFERVEFAPLAGRVLETLTEGDRHKDLFCAGLRLVDEWMQENHDWLRQEVRDEVPLPDWPMIAGVRTKLGNYVADKFVRRVSQLVHDVGTQPAHPFHAKFRAQLDAKITALKSSPEYLAKGEAIKQDLLDHPALRNYAGEIWAALEAWVLADVAQPDSQIRTHLEGLIRGLGEALQSDGELREKLNEQLRGGLVTLAEANRDFVADFIRETVAKWDAEDLCRNLEAEVGRDLQFIRINGTVVGGLVGLLLHLITRLF